MSIFIKSAVQDYMKPSYHFSQNKMITLLYFIHGLIIYSFITLENYQKLDDDFGLIYVAIGILGWFILIGVSFTDTTELLDKIKSWYRSYGHNTSDFWAQIIVLVVYIALLLFLLIAKMNEEFYIPRYIYIYLEAFSIVITLFHIYYAYKVFNIVKDYRSERLSYDSLTSMRPYFITLIGIMLVLFSKNLYFLSYEDEVDFNLWLSWTLFTYMLLLSFYLTLEKLNLGNDTWSDPHWRNDTWRDPHWGDHIVNYIHNRITIINFFIWFSALIPAVIYINSSFLELGSYIPQLVLENKELIVTYINIILGFLLVYFLVDSVESLISLYTKTYGSYRGYGSYRDYRIDLFFAVQVLITGYISMNIFYGNAYLSDYNTLQLSVFLVFGILFAILLRFFFDKRVLVSYLVLSMLLLNNLDINYADLELKTYVWDVFFRDFTDGKDGIAFLVGFIINIFWNIIAAFLYLVLFGWGIDIILNIIYNFGVIFLNVVLIQLVYGILIFFSVYLIRFTIFSKNSYISIFQRTLASAVIAFLAFQLSSGNYSQYLTQFTFEEIKQEQSLDNAVDRTNNMISNTTEVDRSNNTSSNTSECTNYNVVKVQKLNIRDKPGKPSRIVGILNKGESVCIYDFVGKWGRSDLGWVSGKYLSINE